MLTGSLYLSSDFWRWSLRRGKPVFWMRENREVYEGDMESYCRWFVRGKQYKVYLGLSRMKLARVASRSDRRVFLRFNYIVHYNARTWTATRTCKSTLISHLCRC